MDSTDHIQALKAWRDKVKEAAAKKTPPKKEDKK
jgi:hypothetical protein